MSENWTQKFYKDEIKKIYKPKKEKEPSETWKEIKEDFSLNNIKKGGSNLLKAMLKRFLLVLIILSVLLLITYLGLNIFLKIKLN